MNTFRNLLRGVGCVVLGYVVVSLINLPHDWILNTLQPHSVRAGVPLTTSAAVLSSGIVFLAGVAAGFVVSLAAGALRKTILLVLTGLFLLTDLLAVLGPLRTTPLWYQVLLVGLVPLQMWLGWKLAATLTGRSNASAAVPQH